MEDFAQIMELQKDAKKQIDRVKMNYLSNKDFLICDYVLKQLVNIDVSKIDRGKRISLETMVEKSIEEMKIFGMEIENKTLGLLAKTPIRCGYDEEGQFGTAVSYAFDRTDNVIPNSGMIDEYIIPSKLYEFSTYCFAHEHIHAMKETNYKEYKNAITLGETISLFYELMIYNPDEVLKKELLKFRMFWLLNNKKEYILFDNLYIDAWINEWGCETTSDSKSNIYVFMISKIGCYLNSFYYAVILYNMYKESPKKILDLVSRVLKHEITTLQLLEILGIYGDIRGNIFEKELNGIKKILK